MSEVCATLLDPPNTRTRSRSVQSDPRARSRVDAQHPIRCLGRYTLERVGSSGRSVGSPFTGTLKELEAKGSHMHRSNRAHAQPEQLYVPAPELETLESRWWRWKHGSKIHYYAAGHEGPPILMVHGFGAGSFHYDRNIPVLSKSHRVWAVDLLGQGRSWPDDQIPLDPELILSTDTWTQQLLDFITDVIQEPVYIMGNSLGGFLAVSVATNCPALCRGLILLNATPFWWSFSPRLESQSWLGKTWPYRGEMPAPKLLKNTIGPYWFDQLSNPRNIRRLLELVYSKPLDDLEVVERIQEATRHPRAVDSFISMLFAPKAEKTFNEMVDELSIPVCMVYGKEDPWIVPMWGQRLKRRLPDAAYFELSPAGHCPHHEAPGPVNNLVTMWIGESSSPSPLEIEVGASWQERCPLTGREVSVTLLDGSPRNIFERIDALISKLVFDVANGFN